MEKLKDFHNYFNSLHPDIYFSIEIGETHLQFLDVLLEKKCTDLSTVIFFKETDTKRYLNFYSCHQNHTKLSIPYNLARRICTIVLDPLQRLQELRKSLLKRDYS